MKKHLNIAIAVMVLAGALAIGAQAQSPSSPKVVATIPFSFNVSKTTLPAGKYTITVVNPSSDRKTLQIRSANGRSSAMVQTNSVDAGGSDYAKLVFHRYGDRYFFAEAQLAGDSTSLAALKSNAERETEQLLAKAGKKSVVVIVTE